LIPHKTAATLNDRESATRGAAVERAGNFAYNRRQLKLTSFTTDDE
jgi:hypothetical protein